MAQAGLTILAIGNGMVDVISNVSHDFLATKDLQSGSMTLIDSDQSDQLYSQTTSIHEVAGGSAANTAAIAANLGTSVQFATKVSTDQLGEIFTLDMKSMGVSLTLDQAPASAGQTARCLSLITPDGQRTMCTSLGVALTLSPEDITIEQIEAAGVVFLEAYLLDSPFGYAIFEKVFQHKTGKVSLTLSDPKCVQRHIQFLSSHIAKIDILFGNAEEVGALYDTFEPAVSAQRAGEDVSRVICTDGSNGAYIFEQGSLLHLPAIKTAVVDTTGAGDSFAGTCLWGLCHGRSLKDATEMALIVAAEIVSVFGARPVRDLNHILREEGYFKVPA